MSEDRQSVAPEADIPIDDEVTDVPPPVAPKLDSRVPPDRPSQRRAGPSEVPSARRVRTRMTLRIPDDEVARPVSAAMPVAEPAEPAGEIKGTRIISVGPPPGEEPVEPLEPPPSTDTDVTEPPPPVTHVEHEDSWTPFQPVAIDSNPTQRVVSADSTGEQRAVAPVEGAIGADTVDVAEPLDSAEPLDIDDSDATDTPRPPKGPDAVAQIPKLRAAPVIPASPVSAPDLPPPRPPMRALVESEPDGEDIRIEEDEPTSQPPPRMSEPGEAPEVTPEDLVSIESLPKAPRPNPPAAATVGPIPPAKPKVKLAQTPVPTAPASTPPSSKSAAPAVQPSSPAPPVVALPPVAPAPVAPLPVAVPHVAAAAPQAIAAPAAAAPARPVMVPTVLGIAPPAMTEAAAQRKRARPWWEELFNDDYLRAMGKITEPQIGAEVTFIEESLGVSRDGGVLLDLACGTGLHAIELTRRGYHVVGFDLSLAMLARAADEAHDRGQKINFVQGDMREMTFEEIFDGVYCWNTSFGYFDEEKNAQTIQRVHKALKPGGVLLLDVINRDYMIRQAPSLAWFEGEGCVCMDEMSIDWITSRMKNKRTMMFEDGRTKEIEYSIRIYALHELGKLLHDHGFRVAEVSGRTATPGVFFGCESPRALILAEKR